MYVCQCHLSKSICVWHKTSLQRIPYIFSCEKKTTVRLFSANPMKLCSVHRPLKLNFCISCRYFSIVLFCVDIDFFSSPFSYRTLSTQHL